MTAGMTVLVIHTLSVIHLYSVIKHLKAGGSLDESLGVCGLIIVSVED